MFQGTEAGVQNKQKLSYHYLHLFSWKLGPSHRAEMQVVAAAGDSCPIYNSDLFCAKNSVFWHETQSSPSWSLYLSFLIRIV